MPCKFICLFVYVYCVSHVLIITTARDSELSYIWGIGFQSTPPLERAGVFNMPKGDFPQNTEPPFIA